MKTFNDAIKQNTAKEIIPQIDRYIAYCENGKKLVENPIDVKIENDPKESETVTNQHRNRHRISCSANLHNSNFHLSNECEPTIDRRTDDEKGNFSNGL